MTAPHPPLEILRTWQLLGSKAPKRKPARDPMIIQMERAYKGSKQYQLDKLLTVERRYLTRLGMAEAGLARTRKQIRRLLLDLAVPHLTEPIERKGKQ